MSRVFDISWTERSFLCCTHVRRSGHLGGITAMRSAPRIFELHRDEVGCAKSISSGDSIQGIVQSARRF
jgi:hypothetical protein